jgi:hypothetical protein
MSKGDKFYFILIDITYSIAIIMFVLILARSVIQNKDPDFLTIIFLSVGWTVKKEIQTLRRYAEKQTEVKMQ